MNLAARQSAATNASFETPRVSSMSIEQIGQNWFVTLGEHMLQFHQDDAKLIIMKKLFMARYRQNGAMCWTVLEQALADEGFTMPAIARLFTSRRVRQDRIAMFAEALQHDLRHKTFGEWGLATYTAKNGDVYYGLKAR